MNYIRFLPVHKTYITVVKANVSKTKSKMKFYDLFFKINGDNEITLMAVAGHSYPSMLVY